jgi:hypothetical protein
MDLVSLASTHRPRVVVYGVRMAHSSASSRRSPTPGRSRPLRPPCPPARRDASNPSQVLPEERRQLADGFIDLVRASYIDMWFAPLTSYWSFVLR